MDCGLVMLNTSSGFACSHGGSGRFALVLCVRSGILRGGGGGARWVIGNDAFCDPLVASYTDCLPLLAAISSLMGSGRAALVVLLLSLGCLVFYNCQRWKCPCARQDTSDAEYEKRLDTKMSPMLTSGPAIRTLRSALYTSCPCINAVSMTTYYLRLGVFTISLTPLARTAYWLELITCWCLSHDGHAQSSRQTITHISCVSPDMSCILL